MLSRKKLIFISISILILAIVTYTSVIPQTYRDEVEISFPMLKTGEQLSKPERLARWYHPFDSNVSIQQFTPGEAIANLSAGDYSLKVHQPTLTTAILESGYKDLTKQFLFTAIHTNISSCRVSLYYKSSLLAHWIDKGGLQKNAHRSLVQLKTYMEDSRRFYGYPIARTTVVDTAFLFSSAIVPISEKRTATIALFDQLIAYSQQKNADYTGTRIFYADAIGKDQLKLQAGIVIRNRVVTPPGETIQFKRMPFGKNLLVAEYEGAYQEARKVYTALENYKEDHHLTSMAIPYQMFLDKGYDFADSQVVRMKVYYPIY